MKGGKELNFLERIYSSESIAPTKKERQKKKKGIEDDFGCASVNKEVRAIFIRVHEMKHINFTYYWILRWKLFTFWLNKCEKKLFSTKYLPKMMKKTHMIENKRKKNHFWIKQKSLLMVLSWFVMVCDFRLIKFTYSMRCVGLSHLLKVGPSIHVLMDIW